MYRSSINYNVLCVVGFTALCEKYSSMSTAGIDKLTRTLNEYLGSLVEIIIKSNGDVLKFAGNLGKCNAW